MEGTGKDTRRGETAEAGGRAVCSEAFANVQARNVEHGRQRPQQGESSRVEHTAKVESQALVTQWTDQGARRGSERHRVLAWATQL